MLSTRPFRLRADGTGTLRGVREAELLGSGVPGERIRFALDIRLRYRVVRGRIEFAFECPPNANCTAPPHLVGLATPSGLRLASPGQMQVPLHYSRVVTDLERR